MEVIGIIFSVMGTLLGGGPFGILILVVILYFFWMTLRYIWIAFTTGSTHKAKAVVWFI